MREQNPDLTVPLIIGTATGIASGLTVLGIERAMKQNPNEEICMLYRKIKKKYPNLDYETFVEAYNIAIQERKPKYIVKKADIIPTRGGGYVAVPKEKPSMSEKEYKKKLKGLDNEIKQLSNAIDFAYNNMGYYNIKADTQRAELYKEKDKLIEQYEAQKMQNPPRSHERYETFHGVPVDKTFKANIPDPVGEITPIAEIDNIVYECAGKKSVGDDGEDISYIHEWKKNKMILVRDENKNYFIRGKCRVLKSGINDYKGNPSWTMNKPKIKIPKKVTYLGILPEIRAGGKLYKFKNTILCTDGKGQYLYITELRKSIPTHPTFR